MPVGCRSFHFNKKTDAQESGSYISFEKLDGFWKLKGNTARDAQSIPKKVFF